MLAQTMEKNLKLFHQLLEALLKGRLFPAADIFLLAINCSALPAH